MILGLSLEAQKVLKVIAGLCILIIIFQTPLVYNVISVEGISTDHFHKRIIQFSALWAVVLFMVVNCSGVIANLLSSRPMGFFGAISFGLYLFHPVVIGVLSTLNVDTKFDAWIVLLVSSLVAFVSYVVLERPVSMIVLNLKKS